MRNMKLRRIVCEGYEPGTEEMRSEYKIMVRKPNRTQ
jgi:hypothetical protein